MGKYAEVALRATELTRSRRCSSPTEAWEMAAGEVFVGKPEAQRKSCPKGAFLGLCEEGEVVGIRPGSYTTSRDNKAYALEAVRLLRQEPGLADEGPRTLWERVLAGSEKKANSQMEVVIALWKRGSIVGSG